MHVVIETSSCFVPEYSRNQDWTSPRLNASMRTPRDSDVELMPRDTLRAIFFDGGPPPATPLPRNCAPGRRLCVTALQQFCQTNLYWARGQPPRVHYRFLRFQYFAQSRAVSRSPQARLMRLVAISMHVAYTLSSAVTVSALIRPFSMPRPALPGAFRFDRHGFDRHGEGALLIRVHRTHADEFAGDFFATIVMNRHNDGVFPRLTVGGMPDAAFDAQRRDGWRLGPLGAGTETQIMPACRAHGCAFEDGLPTVRTIPGCPRATRAHAAHEPVPPPTP